MSLLVRERRDGGRAPGYLVYLAAGAVAVGAVLCLARGSQPARRPRRPRSRASHVEAITEPAATMAPVVVRGQPPAPESRSYRLNAEPKQGGSRRRGSGGGAQSAPPAEFDPIGAALQAPSEEPAPAAGFAPLPPAFAPDPEDPHDETGSAPRRPASAGGARGGSLFGYRDPSADEAQSEAAPAAAAQPPPCVPRGTLLPVVLLTTVDTGNPAAVLQFAAAAPLVFRHRRLLAFGTRFLGRLSGAPARDRLNLVADEIVRPDGEETPLSASAVEADEAGANLRPGLSARWVPAPPWATIAPYLSEAVTGYLGLLQSRAQRQFAFGVGGLGFSTAAPASAAAPAEQASSQAIQDFTQARLREVEQRYAGHFLIPAGTECWLQLDADLDLRAFRPGTRPSG